MAKTKISTVAKDLNVALTTVIDFLHKKIYKSTTM